MDNMKTAPPIPPQTEFSKRLKNVRLQMKERGLDVLVIFSSPGSLRFGQRGHVMYMSGYEPYFGDTMMVLPQDDKFDALLEIGDAHYFPSDCTWIKNIAQPIDRVYTVKQYLQSIGLSKPKVGIAGEYSMSPALYARFQEELEMEPVSDIIENERMVKSDWELQCIRQASSIAKKGIEAAVKFAKPGKLDLEITSEVERVCRLAGSEFFPHYTMTSSGLDSKYLDWWWKSGKRCLQQGDNFDLDFGTMYAGYCCDISRPFLLGQPSQAQKDVFEIIKQSQEAGRKAASAGTLASDVDKAVRKVYMEAWPEEKSWGIGHGVGLEVHEWPFIGKHGITHNNAYRDSVLKENTVISLEPQIFVPDLGAFTLEDEFVVTKTGAERLNDIPQEIMICK